MSPKDCAYIVERLAIRFMALVADHERQLSEHRTSFGARTEADAKIIARLRSEVEASEGECNVLRPLVVDAAKYKTERDHFYQREGIEQKRRMDAESERDGLLTQVHDMRAEIRQRAKEQDEDHKTIVSLISEREALRAEIAELKTQLERLTSWAAKNQAARDTMQTEIERLKSQSKAPKYKVGDKLESYNRSLGLAIPVTVVGVRTVYDCRAEGAEYLVGHSEDELKERYEQTAYHDTEAGKASAESAVKTEPVVEEIKVGDVVKVRSASGDNTAKSDIGKIGEVRELDSQDGTVLLSGGAGWVSRCDIRKVTT